MPYSKKEILRQHQTATRSTGGQVTSEKEMILVFPERKGYLAALELANEDVKNVTKAVRDHPRRSGALFEPKTQVEGGSHHRVPHGGESQIFLPWV